MQYVGGVADMWLRLVTNTSDGQCIGRCRRYTAVTAVGSLADVHVGGDCSITDWKWHRLSSISGNFACRICKVILGTKQPASLT